MRWGVRWACAERTPGSGIAVNVSSLTVTVEDGDELGRGVDGREGVWRHCRELSGFTGVHGDLAVAEPQAHPPLGHEEPVVTWMHSLLRRLSRRLEAHLDDHSAAGRSIQHPRCALGRAVGGRPDDDVVVAAHVEQCVEVDLECPR
jgi:hypothetical protein